MDTTDPALPATDLQPILSVIQGGTVVGLGEATHGTHEFFQMKHRLVRYLVEQEGFTAFAIEASLPEAEAVNRYVVSGFGNAKGALAGLHFWTWDTYEVLALIEWLRSWNADPSHQKVKFYGFDCQHSARAAEEVMEYLAQVDEGAATHFRASIETAQRGDSAPSALTSSQSMATTAAIQELLDEFDRNRIAWSDVAGASEWRWKRRCAEVLRQSWDIRTGGLANRDRYMAENVAWVLETEQGQRLAIWAHNSHIARSYGRMGDFLATRFGERYRTIGFAFGKGQFRAKPAAGSNEVRTITVSAEGAGELDKALLAVPMPILALDLRGAAPPVHEPISMREFGALAPNPGLHVERDVARSFDVIIFVRDTTAARPTPTGIRPPRSSK